MSSPQNAVLALGAFWLMPLLQPLSAVFLAMLIVARGVRAAAILAALAGGTLCLFWLVLGGSLSWLLAGLALGWLPVFGLAVVWQSTRSVTLTLQLSVIAAMLGLVTFWVIAGDLTAFWRPILEGFEAYYLEAGYEQAVTEWRQARAEHPELPIMLTTMVVAGTWLLAVVEFMLGGALYNCLPGDRPKFDRFRDIDFGRTLAIVMLVMLAVAFATGADLAHELTLVLFTAFLLQGFAVGHWLHLEGHAPFVVALSLYLLPFLIGAIALIAVAVIGFLDAWFGIRRQWKKRKVEQ